MEAFEEINLDTKKDIIIDGLMKSNGVYLLVSKPKVGKSLFALQLANSIANGIKFLGYDIIKPSPVLYVTTELDSSQIKQRCILLGIKFKNKNFFSIDRNKKPAINFMDIEYQIKEFAEEYNGKILILDMIKDINFGVTYDINNYQDISQKLLPKIRSIADKYDLTILLVHHLNKLGKTLGSTGFEAVADGVIRLSESSYDKKIIKLETLNRDFPDIEEYLSKSNTGIFSIAPDGFDDYVNPNLVYLIKYVVEKKSFDTTIGELLKDAKLMCRPTQIGKLIHNNKALLANEGVTFSTYRTSKDRMYHFEYHEPSLDEND